MAAPPKHPLKYPEADRIIRKACKDRGTTMTAVCRQVGVSQDTLRNWLIGRHQPERTDLVRLEEVLDLPQLLDGETLPFVTTYYVLTCPLEVSDKCRGTRSISLHTHHLSPTAELDPLTGIGTYPCHPCASTDAQSRRWGPLKRSKKKGDKGRRRIEEIGATFEEMRAKRNPEKNRNAIDAMARKRTEQGLSKEWRASLSRAKLGKFGHDKDSTKPRGRFGLCRVCRNPEGGYYLAYQKDPRRPGPFWYQSCFVDWKRGRSCVVAWNKGAEATKESRPPPLKGKIRSSEELGKMFELAMRQRVRGEKVEGPDGSGLAKEFGLSRRQTYQWIQDLLDLLPPDGRGGKQLQRWAHALRHPPK